jgi:excisionase family DNA binding protein
MQLLTVPEVAGRLAVNRRTVERHIACGRLRAVRPVAGSPWRIREEDLEAFVATWDTNQPTHRRLRSAS